MRKGILIFVLLIAIGIPLLIYTSPGIQGKLAHAYYKHKMDNWVKEQKTKMLAGDQGSCVRFDFPDKSWIVLNNEHSCCSGAGFDCVVSFDSKGEFKIDPNKNYCGQEGLKGSLSKLIASSSQEFYGLAEADGLDFK